ncbi:MAG: HAMP domain-containing sensor histidine kinase, partial [Patescibacteria group bacterium]|nr:HAMP domain-containing sensor histidine kinase [Patescibacteria group bacterium]
QQLKDQFLFVTAHELRTPVTSIKWNVETLSEDLKTGKKCTKEHEEILQNLQQSNQHLVDLVNDLLDTSRLEYGTFKYKKVKTDLSQVIEDSVQTVFAMAQEKGVELKWDLDKGIDLVDTDPRRLKEVLVNLLSNAVKYNIEGGKIQVEARIRGRGLLISVKDTGIGIAPENIDKLFAKFYRTEDDNTTEIRGIGLGLYIAREIVERLGGELWVESEGLGRGSTFSFTLPSD